MAWYRRIKATIATGIGSEDPSSQGPRPPPPQAQPQPRRQRDSQPQPQPQPPQVKEEARLTYFSSNHFPSFSSVKELQEYLSQVEGMLQRFATTVQAQKTQLKGIRTAYVLKLLARKRHPRDFPTAFLVLLVEDLEGDILDSLAQEAANAGPGKDVDIAKAKEILKRSGIGNSGPLSKSPKLAPKARTASSGAGGHPRTQSLSRQISGNSDTAPEGASTAAPEEAGGGGGAFYLAISSLLGIDYNFSFRISDNDDEDADGGPDERDGPAEEEEEEEEEGEENDDREERWRLLVQVRDRCMTELAVRIFEPSSAFEWANRTRRGNSGLEVLLEQERQEALAKSVNRSSRGPGSQEALDLAYVNEESLFRLRRRSEGLLSDTSGDIEDDEIPEAERPSVVEADVMAYVDLHDGFEKTVMRRNRLTLERAQVLELLDHYLRGKRDPDQLLADIGLKAQETFRSNPEGLSVAVPRKPVIDNILDEVGDLGDFEVIAVSVVYYCYLSYYSFFSPRITERKNKVCSF